MGNFRAESELENMKALDFLFLFLFFFYGKIYQAACLEYVKNSQIVAGVVFIFLINHYLHRHNHISLKNFILHTLDN